LKPDHHHLPRRRAFVVDPRELQSEAGLQLDAGGGSLLALLNNLSPVVASYNN
jgi:hypothetical protein